MNELLGHYASEISPYQKENYYTIRFLLYEVSEIVKFIEAEKRMVVVGGWGEGSGKLCNGHKVSVIRGGQVLETRYTAECL